MQGKILVSHDQGRYLLKMEGDLRVTLCGSLNRYLDKIFVDEQVEQVVVDLLSAENLDSTTLGLLAKLGIHCQKTYGINVQLFCQDEGILRTLNCMGLDELFEIYQEVPAASDHLEEIEQVSAEVDDLRRQVLEAHKLLVLLNPANQDEFTDLIRALENPDG